MALPGMGTTNYEDMRGLRAAGGGPRAARPRERTFVDHEMGSLHLVGGQRGARLAQAPVGQARHGDGQVHAATHLQLHCRRRPVLGPDGVEAHVRHA